MSVRMEHASAPATGRHAVRVRVARTETVIEGPSPVIVGRHADADIRVANGHVSRRHAVLHTSDRHGWVIEDLASAGGLYHEGRRVEIVPVTGDVQVWLGRPGQGELLEVELLPAPVQGAATVGQDRPRSVTQVGGPGLRVGRSPDNDIVVEDLMSSRFHAEVRRTRAGTLQVADVGSHNGTYVNGSRIERTELVDGDIVGVGRHAFKVVGESLEEFVESGAVAFEVNQLRVRTPQGQVVVDGASFVAAPGTVTALIGPTGCGKSSLLRAVTGAVAAEGDVFYNGRDLFASFQELRGRIGYVPQDDVLHTQLRLGDALRFAAELRLPADTTSDERAKRVAEVMADLGLSERSGVQISSLSGGQRKRANLALELLSRPSVLLLDEPTSGLDPAFEKSVMEQLRRLADAGSTVIVVTHSLHQLHLCDQVVALSARGRVAYVGSPDGLLRHFGRTDHAGIFNDLLGNSASPRFRPTGATERLRSRAVRGGAGTRITPAVRLQPWTSQLWTLARRQLALFCSDRRNALFAALGVIVPALALLMLVPAGALEAATGPHPDAFLLVAVLAVAGSSLGVANAIREIVKERAIFQRERAAGLSIAAYLGSKLAVLGGITVVQCLAMVRLATLRAGSPGPSILLPVPWLELGLDVALASLAAFALGLLLSALVSSSEKAMALVAVVFMVQWLFCGAAMSLQHKPALGAVGYLTSSNWAFASAAASTDVVSLSGHCQQNEILALIGIGHPVDCDPRWSATAMRWTIDVGALAALTAATLLLTGLALQRGDRVAPRPPVDAQARRQS